MLNQVCIQQNTVRTKEPISSIQKTRFKIFRPNHRAGTKPPPIFISWNKPKTNVKIINGKNIAKTRLKNSRSDIIHHKKLTHNRVGARAVQRQRWLWMKPMATTKSTHTKTVRGQLWRRFTDDDLKPINIFFFYAKTWDIVIISKHKKYETYLSSLRQKRYGHI